LVLRLRIEPERVDIQISKAIIYPKKGTTTSDKPIEVKIEPPISGDMAFSLLEAQEIEVEEGKLTGFQCLAEEFITMKVHKFCQLKNRKWIG